MTETPLWPAEVSDDEPSDRDELEEQIATMVSGVTLIETSIVHTDAAPGQMDRFGAWGFTKVSEPADTYPVVRFKVPGQAKAQGSKNAYVRGGRPVMVEANKGLPTWRNQVASKASDMMADHPLLTGPLMLDVVFVFARPKSHYTSTGRLKKGVTDAPTQHNIGDLSKLVRAIEDAMQGIVYKDDDQITTFRNPRKRWGLAAATYITIQPDPLDP